MFKFIACAAGLILLFTSPALTAAVYVYPAQGQSQEKQKSDEGACMSWAKEQTGFDPTAPFQPTAPPPASSAPTANAGKGALGGALLGLGIGAITGHAGTGAAIGAGTGALVGGMRKQDQMQQQSQQQAQYNNQQAAIYAQKQSDFNRAYSVCLQGRGYTVSE